MDVSTLHMLTEDLAAFLSEVSCGDLRVPIPSISGDLGDLYIRLLDRNERLVTTITGEVIAGPRSAPRCRADLDAAADSYGDCGLEAGYRHSASLVENALISAHKQHSPSRDRVRVTNLAMIYEAQISHTVIHTWDIAQALGLSYKPIPGMARQVLRNILLPSTQSDVSSCLDADVKVAVDDTGIFDCVLRLSGRLVPTSGSSSFVSAAAPAAIPSRLSSSVV